MNTFYKWLIKQNYRKDQVGDISRIIIDEVDFLPDKKTKNSLIGHLIYADSEPYYIEALKSAWQEYKIYRNKIN